MMSGKRCGFVVGTGIDIHGLEDRTISLNIRLCLAWHREMVNFAVSFFELVMFLLIT